ncbi:hypothetical protein ACP275_11G107600 [Erythranthe tilingii]
MDVEITVIRFQTWKGNECFNHVVVDQKRCVCCWALVAAELVSHAIKTSNPSHRSMKDWDASAQELVDMFPKKYPLLTGQLWLDGCHVGHPRDALEYVKEHGITLKTVYPYIARRQLDIEPPPFPRIKIRGVTRLKKYDPAEKIFNLLRERPIAGKVYSSEPFKKFKGKGIFDEQVEPPIDGIWWHAVLIIGWGVDSLGRKFYHIKNTWGENWGDEGYAKILCDLVYPLCYVEGGAFFVNP